jgi:hypothetical protein
MIGVGDYARTPDGVVYIFGREGDRYQTVSTDREEQREYHGSEPSPWSPEFGEHVSEAGNEDSPTGIVVGNDDGTSSVKWDVFMRLQAWLISDLQPVWVG